MSEAALLDPAGTPSSAGGPYNRQPATGAAAADPRGDGGAGEKSSGTRELETVSFGIVFAPDAEVQGGRQGEHTVGEEQVLQMQPAQQPQQLAQPMGDGAAHDLQHTDQGTALQSVEGVGEPPEPSGSGPEPSRPAAAESDEPPLCITLAGGFLPLVEADQPDQPFIDPKP